MQQCRLLAGLDADGKEMMSDVVLVAIIAGVFNLLAVVAGRFLSRKEHAHALRDIAEIKGLLNGKDHK